MIIMVKVEEWLVVSELMGGLMTQLAFKSGLKYPFLVHIYRKCLLAQCNEKPYISFYLITELMHCHLIGY